MDPDLNAIRRCAGGDRNSFGVLVRKYEGQAIAHALTILSNREDARDAVQDAFTDAFKAICQFDQSKNFYPWLYVILRNRCYASLRKRRRQSDASEELARGLILSIEPGDWASIDLEDALHQLKAEEREILLLKYVDGLTYREIAERLEIAIGTVMSCLHYARCRIKEILQPVAKS